RENAGDQTGGTGCGKQVEFENCRVRGGCFYERRDALHNVMEARPRNRESEAIEIRLYRRNTPEQYKGNQQQVGHPGSEDLATRMSGGAGGGFDGRKVLRVLVIGDGGLDLAGPPELQ